MKHSMLKTWAFFLMFVLVFSISAYRSDYVHADRDEHEYQADHREYENEQGESEHQEYHEDEDQYEGEEQHESKPDEGFKNTNNNEQSGVNKTEVQPQPTAVDIQDQNPPVNQEIPAAVKPVPASENAEPPAAGSSPVQFVDGQTVLLMMSGLDKPLTLTLRVQNGELRVAAEKVLRPMNIPYVTYPDGSLFELYTGGHHLIFRDGKKAFYDNGQKRFISMAPQSVKGYFYLPLTLLAERLGYALEWSSQSQTFRMKKEG